MNYKRANYIVGLSLLLISAIAYLITIHPSISFWNSGEYAACAVSLSIPHGPGAPLWIILAKFATFIPIGSDPALRINIFSALCSGVTIFLLYLIIVELIKSRNGEISSKSNAFIAFGSAAIGSLSFAFCYSFWSVAHISDVYAFGTMIIALCLWFVYKWWNSPEPEGSIKYLYMTGFLIGLSLGAEIFAAQLVLFIVLVFYFKKFEFSRKSLLIALGISIVALIIISPILSGWYPFWLSGNIKSLKIQNSSVIKFLAFLVIPVILIGIIIAYQKSKKNLVMGLTLLILVIAGYSTYISVFIRAGSDNISVNENTPKTLAYLADYINTENNQPHFWPRRYSGEPEYSRMWTNYTDDMSFAWNYQINHMFTRYLGWQYIGPGDEQNPGVDWSKLYGIPLFIGLFGIFYHFKKSWKSGLAFLFLFLLFGLFTAIYLNYQFPQPRERDYIFLGAFLIFSIWIGIGIFGLCELAVQKIKSQSLKNFSEYSLLILAFIFIPVNSLRINFPEQNQSNNHVPFDYAYNTLQSVEKDGILFTNGDNDTYPLWYLQVLGYRQDVSVININLLNEEWYFKFLKDSQPFGAMKIPINLSTDQFASLKPVQWGDFRVVSLALTNDSDSNEKMSWKIPATITTRDNIKCVRKSDLVILDIIKSNNWKRPVHFSSFVGESNNIGLSDYLVSEGLAKRLVSGKDESGSQFRVDEKLYDELMTSKPEYSKSEQTGFFFTNLNKKPLSLDDVSKTVVQSYRTQYLALAYSYLSSDTQKVAEVLNKMESNIPHSVVPIDYKTQHDVAMLYYQIGDKGKFNELSKDVEKKAKEELAMNPDDIQSPWNPYKLLLDIYDGRGDYNNELDILHKLQKITPDSHEVSDKIESVKSKMEGKNNNP